MRLIMRGLNPFIAVYITSATYTTLKPTKFKTGCNLGHRLGALLSVGELEKPPRGEGKDPATLHQTSDIAFLKANIIANFGEVSFLLFSTPFPVATKNHNITMPKKLAKQSTNSSLATTTSATTSSFPASLSSGPLPALFVFDLDYTLWPFWVDTHVTPPLKPNGDRTAGTDRYGEDYAFYTDVPSVLLALPRLGAKMAVASRTSAPTIARELLKMIYLPPVEDAEGGGSSKPKKAIDVFDAGLEIYPGSKIKHFELIQKRTGIKFEDMLFFDDEARNKETESLGVTMCLIRDGVTWGEIERGVADWRKRRGHG